MRKPLRIKITTGNLFIICDNAAIKQKRNFMVQGPVSELINKFPAFTKYTVQVGRAAG
jgi:hypothetical protein